METRRNWLAALTGTLALSRISAQEYSRNGARLKLGVASYSFRKFPRAKAIELTRQLGTPYLNVKDFHLPLDSTPEQIAAARKDFDDAGIVIVGCGNISFDKADDADIRRKFNYAKLLGSPLIVCAPTHETLPLLEPFVRQFDIKIAIHNHGPEDKYFPTPKSVLQAVASMDERCGLCMDIGHTSRTGADIVASMAAAGSRLLDMHLKDLADPRKKESQVPVGQGHLPIEDIFAQLIRMKYAGAANLEYEIDENDPYPGMAKSFAYMRSVLQKFGASESHRLVTAQNG